MADEVKPYATLAEAETALVELGLMGLNNSAAVEAELRRDERFIRLLATARAGFADSEKVRRAWISGFITGAVGHGPVKSHAVAGKVCAACQRYRNEAEGMVEFGLTQIDLTLETVTQPAQQEDRTDG